MVSQVLNFTIKADTSSAEGGARRVGAAFNDLGGAASSLVTKFEVTDTNANRVAKSLGVELSSGAERAVAKLEGLRDHLVRTGAPAADMQRVTEALAAADQKYAASLTVTTQRMGFWEQNGTKIAATAGAMGAAVLAFGTKAVSAFSESQKIGAQLDAVLKSTGGSAGVTKQQVLGLADSLSRITPFDDEVITQGENLLLTFTNIGKDVFPRAIESALDLATALGIDVVSASKMLGKALDQPSEGLGALSKATGKFTEAEQAAIKHMVEMGDTVGAQIAILDKLDTKFGKSARAAGAEFGGSLDIARTAAGNFMEAIGKELTPALEGLTKTFPNLTIAGVGLHDAWGDLNISGGELLIAIPLLKTAFAGMGTTAAALFASAGPIALGIALIASLTAAVYLSITAIQAFSEKQISMVNANITASRATEGLTKKAKEYGITLQKGGETQEQYNAKLFQAIVAHEKLQPKIEKVDKVAKSHVLTLQQQIDKQRALVERLSHTEDQSEKLTAETAKLDAMIRKSGEGAAKVTKEHERLEKQYSSTAGKIVLEIKAIEDDIKSMEKHKVSADALSEAKNRLGQKTLELIASQSGHKEILEKTTVAFQENTVKALGNMSAVEMLEIAWKEYVDTLNQGARALLAIDFDPVISNVDTLNEAFKRGEDVIPFLEKLPESLKPAEQGFKDLDREVSTVVTDLGKGIADALIKWEGFGSSMTKIAREFGTGILRTLIQTWFEPLKKLLNDVAGSITDSLAGVFDGLGDKISGFFKNLDLGKVVGAVAGIGTGIAGVFQGGKSGAAMSIGGGALAGGSIGSMIAPGIGTAIGAAVGAAAGGLASLIRSLTSRGRDKSTATGSADPNNLSGAAGLSFQVWQQIIPDVKAGNMTIEEGITAVNAAWASYEKFLRENLKDQTVIQRSLDTQRGTLTQSLAELDALGTQFDAQQKQLKTDEAIANLQKLGAQFLETGQMSDEFSKAVTDAGGSVEFFNKAAGEIQRLQGLRNELGALRQMVNSLLPPVKTWQEEFFETGQLTQAMAAKIREAGGDIESFVKFGQLRGVKTRFEELTEEFNKTGVASKELLDLMGEFGGTEVAASFKKLMDEAEKSGKTVGQLGKDSESSAAAIQAAFEATSGGINKAFGDAAKTLSDTLQKMDENLGKAIGDLQAAMVTMIKNLIDVLLGVPGAAEKAARDANFFLGSIKPREVSVTIRSTFDDAGIRELENRIARLDATAAGQLRKFTDPGEAREPDKVFRMASGGIITQPYLLTNPRTGQTEGMIGEAGPEAVVPLKRAGTTGGGTTTGGGDVHLHFDFSGVVDREGMKRMVREHVAPELTKAFNGNVGGSRELMNAALRSTRR